MIDDRLTRDIESQAKAYPMFRTDILTTDGGHEVRRSIWTYPRHRFVFNVSPGDPTRNNPLADQVYTELRDLYYAAGGAADTFLFTHWDDYEAVDEAVLFNAGSNTVAQLMRIYTRGSTTRRRKIIKPVDGTLTIKRNGVLYAASNYSVNYDTGVVTFNASQAGQTITASFEFDVPVRFMDDEIELVGIVPRLSQAVNITLMEVRSAT